MSCVYIYINVCKLYNYDHILYTNHQEINIYCN